MSSKNSMTRHKDNGNPVVVALGLSYRSGAISTRGVAWQVDEIIMLRSMMQMYIKGSSSAVKLYQKAFEATLSIEHKDENGNYIHAELNAYGQILAISEANEDRMPGNTMQFCFHLGEGNEETIKRHMIYLKMASLSCFVPFIAQLVEVR